MTVYEEVIRHKVYRRRVTSAGTVTWRVRDSEIELLLVKQVGDERNWSFPKGKLEKSETLELCAERETLEETSIAVRAMEYVITLQKYSHEEKCKKSIYLYTAELLDPHAEIDWDKVPAQEITHVEWVKLSDLEENRQLVKPYQQIVLPCARAKIENKLIRDGSGESSLYESDVFACLDKILLYAPWIDEWALLKRELIKNTVGRARKMFSTTRFSSDALVSDFEQRLIFRWNQLTKNSIPTTDGTQPTEEIARARVETSYKRRNS